MTGTPHEVAGESWLRLSAEQRVPVGLEKTERTLVTGEDDFWILIDASTSDMGVGELLRPVTETGGGEDEWIVMHSRVVVRKSPSTKAEILGFHKKGKTISGVVTKADALEWLKVKHEHGGLGIVDAYMLIDGATVGLGVLLEKATTSGAKAMQLKSPTQILKALHAVAIENLGDLSKWTHSARGEHGVYTVTHTQALSRNMPSSQAKPVGCFSKGAVVGGEIRHGWLLLDPSVPAESLANGGGKWMRIDDSLARQFLTPDVKRILGEAPQGLEQAALGPAEAEGAEKRATHLEENSAEVRTPGNDEASELRAALQRERLARQGAEQRALHLEMQCIMHAVRA